MIELATMTLFLIIYAAGVVVGFCGLGKNKRAAILTILGWGLLLCLSAFQIIFGYGGIIEQLADWELIPNVIYELAFRINEVAYTILFTWKLAPLVIWPAAYAGILLGLYFLHSPTGEPAGPLELPAESGGE